MSSRTERFFTWIWRINGLVLLGLVILTGLELADFAFETASVDARLLGKENNFEAAGADIKGSALHLHEFTAVFGTSFLYAPLDEFGSSYGMSSGRAMAMRNVLFFNSADGKAHWLFEGNDQSISTLQFVPDGVRGLNEAQDHKQATTAIVIDLSTPALSDTPQSKRVRKLAIASPDGRNVTTVVEAIDDFLGYFQASENTVLMFYLAGGHAKALTYDVAGHRTLSDTVLSAGQ